jgi:ubiquinone/menaquinone biosynthesis C-methylase UbiE
VTAQQSRTPAETYEYYLGPSLFEPWARVLVERASPRPGERVVDLACGTGIVTRMVAPLVGDSGSVTGVDLSPDMLDVARTHPAHANLDIEWRQGNASELDLPSESADLVLCQQGVQFFPDRDAAAREIHRVLADGGRVVVAVWQSLERHEVFKALFTAEARHLGLPVAQIATPCAFPERTKLQKLFENAGFTDVKVEQVTRDVRFPAVDEWLELTVRAGAAVIPELAQDGEAFSALLRSVQAEAGDVIDSHRDGDAIVFPMHSNIAVARK